MKKGTFCLSIDTELMWGRHAHHPYEFVERVKKEREIIKRFLEMFLRYDIHATWAVVGHLFLDSCSVEKNIKHPDIVKPQMMKGKKDWFDLDPCTSLKKDPGWYGADIIEKIQSVKGQEIGSHSFSHILFGDTACTKLCAESDIKKCFELAKKKNIKLKSFIFPVNSVGYLDVLKKYGFTSFRGPELHFYSGFPFVSRLGMIFDLFLSTPPVYDSEVKEGLTNIAGSMYFVSARGLRSRIPRGIRYKKAKRGIDKAIQTGKIFHLWTHPTDFADSTSTLMNEFESILKYVFEKSEQGLLDIKTMGEIAG